MNKIFLRFIAVICLLSIVVTVFSACKGKTDDETGTTADPFSVTEYPATVTTAVNPAVNPSNPASSPFSSSPSSSGSTTSTTGMFDDFATTTKPATTTQRSSTYTPSATFTLPTPGITEPTVPPTLPPTVDPGLTNTTNGGSSVDLKKLLSAFGYAYDPDEDCFYSELDSWQRKGGFAPHYDLGAFLLNMHYLTFTVDFDWGGESWRIQFWKGNYSPILDGAEIGIYTKPLGSDTTLYDTADDQHLLNMSMTLYKKNPKCEATRYFSRPETDHWWLTGFKLVNSSSDSRPGKMVLVATIRFRDSEMADAFTSALVHVRGNYAPRHVFREVPLTMPLTDECFHRDGNTVTLCWRAVGWLNYDFPSEDETTQTKKAD